MHKRIVVKISGEALGGAAGSGIDHPTVDEFAREIIKINKLGYEVGVVVGGGNLWRGIENTSTVDRAAGDYMGMLGTIMNATALQQAIERLGAESRCMTSLTIPEVAEPYIRRRALRHLEKKRIIIFGGGTGMPFFSTDTTAALRAAEIGATAILMAKNGVDGIYDKDPNKYDDAIRFDSLTYDEMAEKNIQIMDATAYSFAKDNNIELIVFNGNESGNISKALQEEIKRTIVTN